MGLFDFLGKLSIANKLEKEVGTGAGYVYLTDKENEKRLAESLQNNLDNNNNEQLNESKKNIINSLKEFLNDSGKFLNDNQRKKIYDYIEKIDNCTTESFDFYNSEIQSYINNLRPFFYINHAMNELREKISIIDDERITPQNKEEIYNRINNIVNSKTTEEIKNNMKILDNYLHEELKVNVNFDYIYSELEKAIN